MIQRPAGLPVYRNPPIDEVAISVQFLPVEGFLDEHIREYWHTVRADYPLAQPMPRIEAPVEPIDSSAPAPPMQIQLQMSGMIPTQGRMWLINEADDFLVQVQNSRFIQNWRRRETAYPYFEAINDLFWLNYRKFEQFLRDADLPQPQVQQVEVTYINWISDMPMISFFKPAGVATISVFGEDRQPEDQNWTARYLIRSENELVERLYVQCLPALRPQASAERGTHFALTFRAARLAGIPDDEAAELIGTARTVIVNTFAELTTDAAQESWGRVQ
jgi:uncharacterized protein (TIGR04255 family)